jgi:hypothetical protein
MKSRQDRITALEERLRQLKNAQQRAEAHRRHIESKRHRQADLRRKILIGAVVLGLVDQGKLPERDLRAWLDQAIQRQDDRALFHL